MSTFILGIALIVLVVATYQVSKLRTQSKELERRKLRAIVKALPGWQPQIMIMHIEDRYNYLEIAAKLEMPAKYVLAEMKKAYGVLREHELVQESPSRRRRLTFQARLIWSLIGGRG